MIDTIQEHKVDTEILSVKGKAKILDIGCRGFAFTNEMLKHGHFVCSVDIDDLPEQNYFKCAIGGENKKVGVDKNNSDPQATKVKDGDEIKMFTIETFTELIDQQSSLKVKYWDLVKLDIEGAEYEAIMALTKAISKQISIEFHLHTGIYQEIQVDEIVAHLEKLGYSTVSHEKTSQHGLPPNYWSSLFIFNY